MRNAEIKLRRWLREARSSVRAVIDSEVEGETSMLTVSDVARLVALDDALILIRSRLVSESPSRRS